MDTQRRRWSRYALALLVAIVVLHTVRVPLGTLAVALFVLAGLLLMLAVRRRPVNGPGTAASHRGSR